MKCKHCGDDHVIFLGLWYVQVGDIFILQNCYACPNCKISFTRLVPESQLYYVQQDGTIIARPPHIIVQHERKLNMIDYDPAFVVRKE